MDPESDLVDLPSKTSIDPSLPWTGVSSGYKVGTLNWADGESTSKTVSIKVRDDREMEGTGVSQSDTVQKDANGKAVDNKNTMVYLRDDDLVLPGGYLQAQDRAIRIAEHDEDRDFNVNSIRRLQGSPKKLTLNTELGVRPSSDQLQLNNLEALTWVDGELGTRSFQLRAPTDKIASYYEIDNSFNGPDVPA